MFLQSRFTCAVGIVALLVLSPMSLASAHNQQGSYNEQGSHNQQGCPKGQVLSSNGYGNVECTNPTPGVNVACPPGQVMAGIANGEAVCVALVYAGAYMLNRDNTCRYGNPLTGDCSCPPGATAHQSFDFLNGNGQTCPNGYYFDSGQHGNNCGVTGFTCIY